MFKQTLSIISLIRRTAFIMFAAASLVSFGACGMSKPDQALCGQYYARIVQLSSGSHPALVAAARTGEGKTAVTEHCKQLSRSQAKCSVGAGTLQDAVDCEQADRKTFFEKYF